MVHKYTYLNEASLNILPLLFAEELRVEAVILPLVLGRELVIAVDDPGPLVWRHAAESLTQSRDAAPW